MQLILANPLWIVLAIVTIAVHVGFILAVRRMMKQDPRPNDAQGPDSEDAHD